MRKRLPARRVWGPPLAVAVISSVGLLAALFGDGLWDAVSWIALGVPVAICLRALGPKGPGQGRKNAHREAEP